MPVVPAAVAAEAENVQIPYSPNVKSRFRVVAEWEIDQIRTRIQQEIDQLRAQEEYEIRQWQQMLAQVDQTVPDPTLVRIGNRPAGRDPYAEAPELSDNPDGVVADFTAAHEEEAQREAAQEAAREAKRRRR
ncbi:hypothetical protein MPTA5024_11130 [Microbispora sp. ATCC PTA-5024]|nr:hypothetical protein MPTA5024_11130 [Microbispora sp. ATCC PTA-5024]